MLNKKVLISCYSESSRERLKIILSEYSFVSVFIENFAEVEKLKIGQIGLINIIIKNGFESDDLIVITEQDLFGEKIIKISKSSNNLEKILREQIDLNIGNLVVHRDYGLGRFIGLVTIEKYNNIANDYLKIEYANAAHLFVPIEDFDLITRYGEFNEDTVLDKLGSEKWAIKRNKVKEKLELIAKDLIKIASLRQLSKAPILVPNENEYKEFCARFEYTETDDQLKAIKDVENDFQKSTPADRLICGDVGFGKTEVALRAAFIAASSEKNAVQVAIVVPTTLLCKQHYNLFKERFQYTGLNVATISRLTSTTQNKKVKEDLAQGKVDIVIGTHALLSDTIKFKNLGLLIIDEEQRFGVKQKEKLKEISSGIHLLTLSATPIPRTLQMAMTGIRELSLITTPPVDRLNINTYVMNFDEIILGEAIKREVNRDGKVIIVVPRISDIPSVESKLKDVLCNSKNKEKKLHQFYERQIFPECKKSETEDCYKITHGQMPSNKLDTIINDFYDGKFKILIATTIVENGLDIPDANTIIIYKADRFGLSQLHQLRGRVGRGKKIAYAYLTTNQNEKITENAEKRLKAIKEIQDVGGGFAIASSDMDIRGSGNIVGEEQSGFIRETGVELYNQLLIEAVQKVKNGNNFTSIEYDFSPQIKLNTSTSISKDYINDITLRLSYYRKLANIKTEEESKSIITELESRFGNPPQEIHNLLEIAKIKDLSKKCNITKLELNGENIDISFYNNKFKNPDYLIQLIQKGKAKMKKQNILSFAIIGKPFERIENILT
ncbi:MAG: helicase-related protein, partial [Rickettsiales bacterium]|nr:helicase-related protein [Rickettsiales bacterium]